MMQSTVFPCWATVSYKYPDTT